MQLPRLDSDSDEDVEDEDEDEGEFETDRFGNTVRRGKPAVEATAEGDEDEDDEEDLETDRFGNTIPRVKPIDEASAEIDEGKEEVDSDAEIEALTKNLHLAADSVKKTQQMRDERRRQLEIEGGGLAGGDKDALGGGFAFSSMEDVQRQQVASVLLERTAVAAAGDAVVQLPESVFHQWNADQERKQTEQRDQEPEAEAKTAASP